MAWVRGPGEQAQPTPSDRQRPGAVAVGARDGRALELLFRGAARQVSGISCRRRRRDEDRHQDLLAARARGLQDPVRLFVWAAMPESGRRVATTRGPGITSANCETRGVVMTTTTITRDGDVRASSGHRGVTSRRSASQLGSLCPAAPYPRRAGSAHARGDSTSLDRRTPGRPLERRGGARPRPGEVGDRGGDRWALRRNTRLRGHHITVTAGADGLVTLTGAVPTQALRREVELSCWTVPGVWTLHDDLAVGRSATARKLRVLPLPGPSPWCRYR